MLESGGDGGRVPHDAYAYLFEAKGIGRYIMDSGQLRDIIGASDLVSDLCASGLDEKTSSDGGGKPDQGLHDLIGHVALAAGMPAGSAFSRRASAAFCAHGTKPELDRLRALWRLVFGLTRPGLEGSDALAKAPATGMPTDADVRAIKEVYRAGSGVRFNGAADLLPTGHPFTLFNPRSGRIASMLQVYPGPGGTLSSDSVQRLDLVTDPQRAWADGQRTTATGPAARALTPEDRARVVFPRNLESDADSRENPGFPFRGDDRRLAVVHADLSGLGEIFMRVADTAETRNDVRTVAEAIERAVLAATRAAVKRVVLPAIGDGAGIVPARPVLIGGDDITFLVRADLALGFTRALLGAIETETRAALDGLRTGPGAWRTELPDRLSACGGVAIVGQGHPFLLANALAESLCKHAKGVAKARGARTPYPSLYAFHATTTALSGDYKDIRTNELMDGALTANPYHLGPPQGRPRGATLDAWLDAVTQALRDMPRGRGKLVEALRLWPREPDRANAVWKRWRDVAAVDEEAAGFASLRQALGGEVPDRIDDVAGLISDALEAVDIGTPANPKKDAA